MVTPDPRRWLLPLLALGLTWGAGLPGAGQEPELTLPETPEAATEPLEVKAGELWERPSSFLGRTVVMRVQVQRRLESWNPFTTRFGDGEYAAWQAWSDEQFPWVEEDFRAPRVRLFARLGGSAERALGKAATHARLELTGVVRSVFAGRPWFEVLSARPLVRQIGEGCVLHASRGLELMEQEQWVGALAELERAASEGLPAHARVELERLQEECRAAIARAPHAPPGG